MADLVILCFSSSQNSARPSCLETTRPHLPQGELVSFGECKLLKLRERANWCHEARKEHRFAADWLQVGRPGTRRWSGRTEVQLTSEFRSRGRKGNERQVTNLSDYGCRLEQVGNLPVGSYSWVKFPTLGSWYARIAWCDGTTAGLDFAEPLHPAVTDMLISRETQVPALAEPLERNEL